VRAEIVVVLVVAQQVVDDHQHAVADGNDGDLVQSQSSYGVDLVDPTLKTHWYQAETGYDLMHFSIDWQAEAVTCP
jgi:hypothetical protein